MKWSNLVITAGSSVTITFKVTVNGTGLIINNVTISSNITNIGNNTASVVITIPVTVNLTISKTASVSHPSYGQSINYTINVVNHGSDVAHNVVVSDVLDPRLVLVGSYPGVTYNAVIRTLTWNVGNLSSGDSRNLTFTVLVNGTGNITNTANVSSNETNLGNRTAGVLISVPSAVNLTLSKVANVSGNVTKGQIIQYIITAGNLGPDTGTNVIVNEVLPKSLIFISSSPSVGFYNPSTGVWSIGNLNVGETVRLIITVKVNGTGTIVNGINISSDQQNINNYINHTNITFNITVSPNNKTNDTNKTNKTPEKYKPYLKREKRNNIMKKNLNMKNQCKISD